MTENLIHKLEEKMMTLLSEVESLRMETQRLHHENATLKTERDNHTKKLHELISLLDTVSGEEKIASAA